MQLAYLGVASSPEAGLVVFLGSESWASVELKGPAHSSPLRLLEAPFSHLWTCSMGDSCLPSQPRTVCSAANLSSQLS